MFGKIALSLLVSLLLFASPAAAALLTPQEMKGVTQSIGLPTENVVFQHVPDADLDAYFEIGGFWECMVDDGACGKIVIAFTGNWSGTPIELRKFVLLHELGHYAQYLEGRNFDEWDADVFAANVACQQGMDGVYWSAAAARWIVSITGRAWGGGEGSIHDSWARRVENVRTKATACNPAQAA